MPTASVARGDRWRATPAPARRSVPGPLLDPFGLARPLADGPRRDRSAFLDRSFALDRDLDLDFAVAAMTAQTSMTTGMMIGLRWVDSKK